jgi:hypothetical protein
VASLEEYCAWKLLEMRPGGSADPFQRSGVAEERFGDFIAHVGWKKTRKRGRR